ncbi:hypothetical protein ACIRRA_22140 [Nocardia sp. NPDC101769]
MTLAATTLPTYSPHAIHIGTAIVLLILVIVLVIGVLLGRCR